jgi:Tfp pilus assembly protein PilP
VLPFIYLGQIVEDQKVQVILARGDRVVTVYVGENIDSNYRVEGLKGGTLTLLYVPLDIKQTLATGVSQ